MSYTLDYVPPAALPQVLPLLEDLIANVIERSAGRWTIESLVRDLMTERFDLLCICSDKKITGIVATHLHETPSGMRILQIPFCTGNDSGGWLHLLAVIEDHARRNGCAKVEMWARKGWQRKLPDYKLTHVMLEKDIA